MEGSEVSVLFSVQAATEAGECLCITGDDEEMGSWDPLKMVKLTRTFSPEGQSRLWNISIPLKSNNTYFYRYVLCKDNSSQKFSTANANPTSHHNVAVENSNLNGFGESVGAEPTALNGDARSHDMNDLVTILKWETGLKPRVLSLDHGQDGSLELPQDIFGVNGGETQIGGGWLVHQSELRVLLHSNPIYMYKPRRRTDQSFSIKCTPVDYSQDSSHTFEDGEESRDSPPLCTRSNVYAWNLNNDSDSHPSPQGPAGMLYNNNDYLVFSSQCTDPQTTGFQLDLYACEANRAPKFIGSSHLLPPKPKESHTKRVVAIIGCNYRPIGELSVELFTASPTAGLEMRLDASYQTYWKKRCVNRGLGTALDIGHRGMGASYSSVNIEKENTVASFQTAASHGADFVELDVLLSKDKVPVIFHDFDVKVQYSNKDTHASQTEHHEIPVHTLNLTQLQSMRLFAGSKNIEINKEESSANNDPFPTLEAILTSVDQSLGYNIEVKYPQQLMDESMETEKYLGRNETLDLILKVVFAHAGSRRIVFSSFDADTCVLLRLKQNKYPVMFLSQGETLLYPHYKDIRTITFEWAIRFAVSERLLGVVLHAEVLLRDISLLQRCYDNNLVVFVWGSDNNDPTMVRKLRELKVHGVIYDRIDCHKPEHHGLEFVLNSTS